VPASVSRAAVSTALAAIPGLTTAIAAACASRTASKILRKEPLAGPSWTVRVKSTQYPS
jgi:hypothetical protein